MSQQNDIFSGDGPVLQQQAARVRWTAHGPPAMRSLSHPATACSLACIQTCPNPWARVRWTAHGPPAMRHLSHPATACSLACIQTGPNPWALMCLTQCLTKNNQPVSTQVCLPSLLYRKTLVSKTTARALFSLSLSLCLSLSVSLSFSRSLSLSSTLN